MAGYGFQPLLCLSGLLYALGMIAVAGLASQLLAFLAELLALFNAFQFRYPVALVYHFLA
jgi:hypothetical protein